MPIADGAVDKAPIIYQRLNDTDASATTNEKRNAVYQRQTLSL